MRTTKILIYSWIIGKKSKDIILKIITNKNLPHIGLAVMFCCLSIIFYDLVGRFNEAPFDGVFQTLFPLRRIDAGELPGRDFFYFHGNGIPYLLYPIYYIVKVITGHELVASLWSTFLVNLLFLYLPIYVFFWKRFGLSSASASILVISSINEFLFIFGFYNSPIFVGAPMGIRMAPHLLMLAVFSSRLSPSERITLKDIFILGCTLGLAPLVAAEQGIFAIGGATLALLFTGDRLKNKLTNSMLLLLISSSVFLIIQIIFFGNLNTLKAMKIISDNQIWVYGVYPNTFFASISEVFSFSKILAFPSQLTTIVATLSIFWLLLWRTKDDALKISVLAMYFGGLLSWVSNVGYVGQHQSAIFMKLILIIGVAYFMQKSQKREFAL
ncbi:MAG: hypothetical protein H7240_04345 [Glaciimonas sp.]|nr:hypothetical protein [Glaciimonas sp.]